jgi:hypothetical protein
MKPSRHQEDGSSHTELLSNGIDIRTGSLHDKVIPAVFPDLSTYISNGKKNSFAGPLLVPTGVVMLSS